MPLHAVLHQRPFGCGDVMAGALLLPPAQLAAEISLLPAVPRQDARVVPMPPIAHRAGGRVVMLVFSDKQPGDTGPVRGGACCSWGWRGAAQCEEPV